MSISRICRQTLTNNHIVVREQNVTPSIVHLGIGAFHRAHQAVYTNEYNKQNPEDAWYILGVSLRSATVRDQLVPQDGFYSVLQTDVKGNDISMINSIQHVLVAPESPRAVLEALTAETTKIISLTITEKGYCHEPATGNLNQSHPDIQHDLSNLTQPKTAIGFLVSSLQARYQQNIPTPTILCCDNLPNNGDTLAKIVLQFSQLIDENLTHWIREHVCFPNTMVDRIVPATTQSDIELLATETGYQDIGMVKTERFSQWVIEDKFSSERPKWEHVGAMLVRDVEPFETAKLRLLNGTHSSLAYLGYLSGYEYVHQVMEDQQLVQYLEHMMLNEIIPTVTAPEGLDLAQYSQDLLTRYRNPALCHRTYQIAMDGSQKLPQRLLHTIEEQLAAGGSIDALTFAVAGWLRYTMAVDEQGKSIDVQDPYAQQLKAVHEQHSGDITLLVERYLAFETIFSKKLANSKMFQSKLSYFLSSIISDGVTHTLKNKLKIIRLNNRS